MSYHHHIEEIQMVGTINNDNAIRRRHSHNHLNLKPTHVLDHIRTKVKRKRSTNNPVIEIPAFSTTNNINGNNNSIRTSEENNELESKTELTEVLSQLNISSQTLPDQYTNRSSEKKNNEEKNLSIKKAENDVIVPDKIDEDENINETVQWRIGPLESDIDNNQKNTKSKLKLNKGSKSLPESTNQFNTIKRRQTIRRTSFQIRDEDFNNIFNDLPPDEQLVIAYPCAWRKDISMHGRMFLSINYLCFYTCFFKWEESLCIAFKDIISVTRDKSVKILPNAIKLQTKNQEQYRFASYIPRERIFIAIFRLWQNALLEKPLDYQQVRAIVYADQMSIDESTGNSEESITLENNGEHSSDRYLHAQSLPPFISDYSREPSITFIPSDQRMISSSLEQTTYVSTCPCETHFARTFVDQLFSYHVDMLFELTFGNNSFTRGSHDAQKLTDYTIGEWRINNETGKRERLVTYKTITQSILGTNTISCNEKQVMEIEKPHSMHIINIEVYNEGMKYTDTFFVATRYCMFQRDAKHSSLRISGEIKYVKNVNGIAKSFIEKNATASLEDGVNNQIRRLENHQAIIHSRKSNQKRTSVSKQRIRKKKDDDASPDEKKDDSALNSVISSKNQALTKEKTITGKGFLFDMGLCIGIFLLFLHIYLCYKLYSIDQALNARDVTCLNQCEKACLENNIHH